MAGTGVACYRDECVLTGGLHTGVRYDSDANKPSESELITFERKLSACDYLCCVRRVLRVHSLVR